MMRLVLFTCISIISTLGYTYLFCKVNNIKAISKTSIFIFFVGVISITVLKYYDVKYITLLSYFLFYPILFYSISKIKIKKIAINTIIIGLIGMSFDLLSMLLASLIVFLLGIDLDKYYNFLSIILSFLVIIAFFILGKSNKVNRVLNKIINFFSDIEYFDYALLTYCIFIMILAISIFTNLDRIDFDLLVLVIIILTAILFVTLIKYKINATEMKKYMKTLKENNDFYIKMDDENRIFKHNLMAKLSSIKSVSNKKAIALIDDYVIKAKKTLNYSKKIKSIPYGINGIIYQRTYPYLEDINFKITNKIDFDIFNVLKPRRYNVLVEKIVVSLDNAIEASLSSKNKIVVINLYDDENNIYVEIKNSFAHDLDVDNLGNLNYSTKGKKRGLGLFSILRDNEALVDFKVVNSYFINIISARKQK